MPVNTSGSQKHPVHIPGCSVCQVAWQYEYISALAGTAVCLNEQPYLHCDLQVADKFQWKSKKNHT